MHLLFLLFLPGIVSADLFLVYAPIHTHWRRQMGYKLVEDRRPIREHPLPASVLFSRPFGQSGRLELLVQSNFTYADIGFDDPWLPSPQQTLGSLHVTVGGQFLELPVIRCATLAQWTAVAAARLDQLKPEVLPASRDYTGWALLGVIGFLAAVAGIATFLLRCKEERATTPTEFPLQELGLDRNWHVTESDMEA